MTTTTRGRRKKAAPDPIKVVTTHPLRPRILEAIAAKGLASPRELTEILTAAGHLDEVKSEGNRLGTTAYHVRVLAKAGAIKLEKKAPRRGAIEHYYRVNAARADETAQALVDAGVNLAAAAHGWVTVAEYEDTRDGNGRRWKVLKRRGDVVDVYHGPTLEAAREHAAGVRRAA